VQVIHSNDFWWGNGLSDDFWWGMGPAFLPADSVLCRAGDAIRAATGGGGGGGKANEGDGGGVDPQKRCFEEVKLISDSRHSQVYSGKFSGISVVKKVHNPIVVSEERFAEEVRIHMMLTAMSCKIAPLLAVQTDGNRRIMYFPKYRHTVASYLRNNPQLSLENRLRICNSMASAVTALHSRNIIHLDLKPSMIMHAHSNRS